MVLAVIGMKFVLGLCTVIGGIAAAIAIWQFVFKPHNAAFTGNVGTYAEAGSLISFLGQHAGQHVNLNVTCNDSGGCGIMQGPSGSPAIALYASPSAARCWPTGGPCSGGALMMFIPGSSGSLPSNGSGNLSAQGTWSLQKYGSGGTSPEGDESYKLTG
jgi:hypothetical protein